MNEVTIVVKAKNDTKLIFDEVRRDSASLGDEVGDKITKHITERITTTSKVSGGGIGTAGDEIGKTFGERISQRITERVHVAFDRIRTGRQNVDVDVHNRPARVNVDVDKKSFLSRITSLGDEAGKSLTGGIGSALQSMFEGVGGVWGILKGTLVAALSPALAAAVSSAIFLALGGGVIAAGVISAFRDPQILGAAKDLKAKLSSMFEEFGKPFRAPVADLLEKFAHFLDTSAPNIHALSQAFAPITGALGTGLISLLQNALPGITDAALAAKPIFETLAKHMPEIGQRIGDFFRTIGKHGPEAAMFFGDLLTVIEHLISVIGKLIGWLTSLYIKVRVVALYMAAMFVNAFAMILTAAANAFGWIPGLGPKIESAKKKFTSFAEHINKSLSGIHDKTVHVTIVGEAVGSAAGLTASKIAHILGRASGGIVGAATGGIRNGLTWVGEHGPELANLPAGTQVHSNPDSMRMAGQGGGGGTLTLKLAPSGNAVLDELFRWLLEHLQETTRTEYAGNANLMLGGAGI